MWNLKFNFSILPERLRTSLLRVNIQFALALLGSVWCGVSLSMFALSKAFIFSNLPHKPFYLLQFANTLDLIICFWTWCSSSLKSVIAAVPNKFMHFLSGWSEIQDMWWLVTRLLQKLLSDGAKIQSILLWNLSMGWEDREVLLCSICSCSS